MTIDDRVEHLVEECVNILGVERMIDELERLRSINTESEKRTLTIIANAGVHKIPERYLRGEVFEASLGNWNCSTQREIVEEFHRILRGVVRKLGEDEWQRIYLFPTGHPALSIQIKTLVYRLTRKNTIDMFYKDGEYFEIAIDAREVALQEPVMQP
jgi:hypothetical protein